MRGRLALSFRDAGGRTGVKRLSQTAPCRALFPRTPRGEPRQAALVNVSGGLVGGDSIETRVSLEPGARALTTTPAAEKIYRSAGREVSVRTALSLDAGARFEWMPQPTILFDGAVLDRRMEIALDADAVLLAGEVLILGRAAHGERLSSGRLLDDWTVRRGGRLEWIDRQRVADWPAALDANAGFRGAAATALFVYAAADASDRLAPARKLLDGAPVPCAATRLGPLLVVRWIGPDAARLIGAYARFWAAFRALVGAGAATLPTLWQT